MTPPGLEPVQSEEERWAGRSADTRERVRHAGRMAWAILGILGVVAVSAYLVSLLSLVVVPLILALFPATLLIPVASWLKARGVPQALASLITILAGIALLAGVIWSMVALVMADLPELIRSADEGLAELESVIQQVAPDTRIEGLGDVVGLVREQLGEAGDLAGQALAAAVGAFETIAGILLLLVALFFYLKDGRRLANALSKVVPESARGRVRGAADEAWDTLGKYFRGQLLVALVDALAIGVGLLLLGIPMVLPLAMLIFFGGLFPIVGAVVTGSLAVLVALAHGGLTMGIIVAGLVLAVQQLEGNVLEPLILGHAIDLHPLVILLSITAGGLLLGLLGAFLAVPFAAIVARTWKRLGEGDRDREMPSPQTR